MDEVATILQKGDTLSIPRMDDRRFYCPYVVRGQLCALIRRWSIRIGDTDKLGTIPYTAMGLEIGLYVPKVYMAACVPPSGELFQWKDEGNHEVLVVVDVVVVIGVGVGRTPRGRPAGKGRTTM